MPRIFPALVHEKKGLQFPHGWDIMTSLHKARFAVMTHTSAHNFTAYYGFTRFTGYGYFVMEQRGIE